MEIKNRATIGLSLVTLAGLALFSWTRTTPVMAQDAEAAKTTQTAPPMKMAEGSALAASGDYIYALKGGTLYQMKASDLSFVAQKDLSAAPPGKP